MDSRHISFWVIRPEVVWLIVGDGVSVGVAVSEIGANVAVGETDVAVAVVGTGAAVVGSDGEADGAASDTGAGSGLPQPARKNKIKTSPEIL